MDVGQVYYGRIFFNSRDLGVIRLKIMKLEVTLVCSDIGELLGRRNRSCYQIYVVIEFFFFVVVFYEFFFLYLVFF